MGLIDDIPTCETLVTRMVKEAEDIIRGITVSIGIDGGQETWDKVASSRESKL